MCNDSESFILIYRKAWLREDQGVKGVLFSEDNILNFVKLAILREAEFLQRDVSRSLSSRRKVVRVGNSF